MIAYDSLSAFDSFWLPSGLSSSQGLRRACYFVCVTKQTSPDIYEDPSFVKLFIQCHLIYFCICLIFISNLSIWIKTMWQLLLVTVRLALAAWIRRQEITEPGNNPRDEKCLMFSCSVTLPLTSLSLALHPVCFVPTYYYVILAYLDTSYQGLL